MQPFKIITAISIICSMMIVSYGFNCLSKNCIIFGRRSLSSRRIIYRRRTETGTNDLDVISTYRSTNDRPFMLPVSLTALKSTNPNKEYEFKSSSNKIGGHLVRKDKNDKVWVSTSQVKLFNLVDGDMICGEYSEQRDDSVRLLKVLTVNGSKSKPKARTESVLNEDDVVRNSNINSNNDNITTERKPVARPPPSSALERLNNRVDDDFRKRRIYIKNLPRDVTWAQLKDRCRLYGVVAYASISHDITTGKSKGEGIVQYETIEEAQRAVQELDNSKMFGSDIRARIDIQENKKKRGAGNNGSSDGNADDDSGKPMNPREWREYKRQVEELGIPAPTFKRAAATDADSSNSSSKKQLNTVAAVPINYPPRDNVVRLNPDSNQPNKEDLPQIEELIKVREMYRSNRQYEEADEVRKQLYNNYKVYVNDKTKLWTIVPDDVKIPLFHPPSTSSA